MIRFKPTVRVDSARRAGNTVAHMKFVLNESDVPDSGLCLIVRALVPGECSAVDMKTLLDDLTPEVQRLLSNYAEAHGVFRIPPPLTEPTKNSS